jgi:hypothetical protein
MTLVNRFPVSVNRGQPSVVMPADPGCLNEILGYPTTGGALLTDTVERDNGKEPDSQPRSVLAGRPSRTDILPPLPTGAQVYPKSMERTSFSAQPAVRCKPN